MESSERPLILQALHFLLKNKNYLERGQKAIPNDNDIEIDIISKYQTAPKIDIFKSPVTAKQNAITFKNINISTNSNFMISLVLK